MFVRAKKSGRYEYLQVVQNERVGGRVRQQAVATLGRVDPLQDQGHIDALLSSYRLHPKLFTGQRPRV